MVSHSQFSLQVLQQEFVFISNLLQRNTCFKLLCVYALRFFIAEKKERYSRYLSVARTILVPLPLLLLQHHE